MTQGTIMTPTLVWLSTCLMVVGPAGAAGGQLADAVQRQDKHAVRALLAARIDVNAPQPDGATALHWAANRNDFETADLLLRAGANVNAVNVYGVTPLTLACENANLALVEMLLKAGANPQAAELNGRTALMVAARTGNVDVVNTLLAAGADVNTKTTTSGQTALMWAISEHHPGVVRVLLDHGADVGARSTAGFTPLMFAAREGDVETGRMLLAKGEAIDETGPFGSALFVAIDSSQVLFGLFLLENGADANATASSSASARRPGEARFGERSALHAAVGTKGEDATLGFPPVEIELQPGERLTLVKELLAHGANPNARGDSSVRTSPDWPKWGVESRKGVTPFWLAADNADVELVRLLLRAGADPNLTSDDNTTALMAAAGLGHDGNPAYERQWTEARALETVKFLVEEAGADVNAASDGNFTALHGTAFTGANSVAEYLVRRGANLDVVASGSLIDKQTPYRIAQGHVGGGYSFTERLTTAALLAKLGANITLGVDPRIAQRERQRERTPSDVPNLRTPTPRP